MPSPTIAQLEAIMPIAHIPQPRNVPTDAVCAYLDNSPHAGPIRLRIIETQYEDRVSYICHLHAYSVLSNPFAYREDLDAVLIHPYYVTTTNLNPLTYAEYRARIAECPRCGRDCDRTALATPLPQRGIAYQGPPVCPHCQDTWFRTCRACGAVEQIPYGVLSGNFTCSSCARFTIQHSKRKYAPIFFKAADTDTDTRFTGAEIELEFTNGTDLHVMTRKLLEPLPDKLMHAETDGSLMHGVEFVSMPLSAQYIEANRGIFEKFYDTASPCIDVHATARNAGLHVHLSRDAIRPEEAARMEQLVTKSGLMSRYLLHLTKRTPDKFSQWASASADPTVVDKLKRGVAQLGVNRYRFLNWTEKTVECRGFAGSHDYKHLLAATQFVRAIHDFAKFDGYENKCVALRKFIANNTRYAELQAYDAAFVDSKDKVGNDPCPTDQRHPGEFTHRGQTYCYNPNPRGRLNDGVEELGSSAYTETMCSRMNAAHIDPVVYDPGSLQTYRLHVGLTAHYVRYNSNELTRADIQCPVTTHRNTLLQVLRADSAAHNHPRGRDILVGAYVFTQLEQLRTLGELESVPQGDSDDDMGIESEEDEDITTF